MEQYEKVIYTIKANTLDRRENFFCVGVGLVVGSMVYDATNSVALSVVSGTVSAMLVRLVGACINDKRLEGILK